MSAIFISMLAKIFNGNAGIFKRVFKAFLAISFGLITITQTATAQDIKTAADLYQGSTENSPAQLEYHRLDAILQEFVWEVGPSSRGIKRPPAPPTGTRYSKANPEKTRFEGNRIFYHRMDAADLEKITNYRKGLMAFPGPYDMRKLSSNEQLAFWLNLYNITVIEYLAQIYPISDLEILRDRGMFSDKLLTVAGVPLSLDDIRTEILSKWQSPLVIYGMFQGAIGGPSIQKEAFKGETVVRQLTVSAVDFVNSLRGTQFWNDRVNVSKIYEWNDYLFPAGDSELLDHLKRYARGSVRGDLAQVVTIERDVFDHHIADLYNGHLGGNSVANGVAGLEFGRALAANGDINTSVANTGISNMIMRVDPAPPHVMELVTEVVNRNRMRGVRVTIEDVLTYEEPREEAGSATPSESGGNDN